jgi:hypothetical protein
MDNYIRILLTDVNNAYNEYINNKNGYTRRNYLKNLFTLLEADIHRERRILYRRLSPIIEDSRLLSLIDPEKLIIKDNGTILQKYAEDSLEKSLKFIIKTYCELANIECTYFNDDGWDNFRLIRKLRNRLIHPKCDEDLSINDREIERAKLAEEWYLSLFRDLIPKIDRNFTNGEIQDFYNRMYKI